MKLTVNHGKASYHYSDQGITSLEEGGKSAFDTNHVKKNVFLAKNKLTSLKGSPKIVDGDFSVALNPITSLEGGPEIVGDDCVFSGTKITSLKGAPTTIGWTLFLQDIEVLKDLKGIHRYINHIGGSLNLVGTPIESHILGIFKIAGLKNVLFNDDQHELQKLCNSIIEGLNKTDPDRKSGESLLDAQDALIDAGFDQYALL